MKVIVYVEGPSDKAAMQSLLRPLIEQKRRKGITIDFFESPSGDKKKTLLLKVPIKAANILLNDADACVVVMPDLYPKNRGFRHETVEELQRGILYSLRKILKSKGAKNDDRFEGRFKVFCFKYDLEALILASKEALEDRLGVKSIPTSWIEPVEDQNHDLPPKRVVEALFRQCGRKYVDTVDAPIILGMMEYSRIVNRCPQCFKPFVEFLEGLEN